jgi:chromosomal replication initiation ATPase DnaA
VKGLPPDALFAAAPGRVSAAIDLAAARIGLTRSELLEPCRLQHVAWARHVAVYVAREATGLSWPALGRAFRRDHSTLMASYAKIASARLRDERLERLVESLLGEVCADERTMADSLRP